MDLTNETEEWWLYLIRMANGNLYCGVTNDLERRFQEHQSSGARCAKALKGKGPLELVYTHSLANKKLALQYEWRVKKWTKQQKEQLILGKKTLDQTIL